MTFAEGVIEMADEGGTGEERIYAGLQQVAAGDVLYLRFLEELDRPEVPDPIAIMPGTRDSCRPRSPRCRWPASTQPPPGPRTACWPCGPIWRSAR